MLSHKQIKERRKEHIYCLFVDMWRDTERSRIIPKLQTSVNLE